MIHNFISRRLGRLRRLRRWLRPNPHEKHAQREYRKVLRKRFFRLRAIVLGISILVYLYSRAIRATQVLEYVGDAPTLAAYPKHEPPVIIVMWHDAIFAATIYAGRYFPWRGRTLHLLISGSEDTRVLRNFIRLYGFRYALGSSSHGGHSALRTLRGLLNSGKHIVITPDGPRGPRRKLKGGAIALAKMTGSPIVLCTSNDSRQWIARTWDQARISKPFARVRVAMSEPIYIDRATDTAEAETAVQQEMDRLYELVEQRNTLI